MAPITARLGIVVLGIWLVAGGVPPATAVVDPAAPPGGATVTVDAAGRVSLHTDRGLPLAEIVRAIGAAVGADVTVRRDPGTVGPLAVDGIAADDLLARLAGHHSLAMRYADDRLVEIILVARRGQAPGNDAEAAPAAPRATPVGTFRPPPPSPAEVERSRRAAEIRDVVKLSYRSDAAATAELARLVTAGADPAVRGAAASALLGSGRADPALVERALADADAQVRLRAAQGLWVAQGRAATDRLRAMASREPAPEVRAALADLLAARPDAPVADGPHPARVDR